MFSGVYAVRPEMAPGPETVAVVTKGFFFPSPVFADKEQGK
jgi:hypothetical protein